jgi:hypothetical protein
LLDDGYITCIDDLDTSSPFPTKPMERLDITRDVAVSIAKKYREKVNAEQKAAMEIQPAALTL